MMETILLYSSSLVISFIAVALKGFQHKNVIGDHMKAVFFTSYLMMFFDVAAISIVIKGGYMTAFSAGTGAAFGMVFSLWLHPKVFSKGKTSNG